MGPLPIDIPKRLRLVARDTLCLSLLLVLVLLLPDLVLAMPAGPDTQPSPRLVERYTDTMSIVLWGVIFFVLTCVGPIAALNYFISGDGKWAFAGGMIFGFSEQVRLRKRLNPWDALFWGLVGYFGPPLVVIFIGPFGLYQLSIKPILLRTDEATATICCYNTDASFVLSNDGRWLLGHKSEWTVFSEKKAAGNVFLVDTNAGAFVRFKAKDGKYLPYWRVAAGVKGAYGLRDVSWDPADGHYLRADYDRIEHRRDRVDWVRGVETYDLKQISLGPVLIQRPMVSAPENFRLDSYVNETATFVSLQRTVALDVGGDTLTVDASGTIAAVIAYDMESWMDAGTLTFWHLPSGQRIQEYRVRYMPTNPSWKVSYGGDVWVYLIDGHIKIFRPTAGWTPALAGKAGGASGNGTDRVLSNPWLDS